MARSNCCEAAALNALRRWFAPSKINSWLMPRAGNVRWASSCELSLTGRLPARTRVRRGVLTTIRNAQSSPVKASTRERCASTLVMHRNTGCARPKAAQVKMGSADVLPFKRNMVQSCGCDETTTFSCVRVPSGGRFSPGGRAGARTARTLAQRCRDWG